MSKRQGYKVLKLQGFVHHRGGTWINPSTGTQARFGWSDTGWVIHYWAKR